MGTQAPWENAGMKNDGQEQRPQIGDAADIGGGEQSGEGT